LTGDYALASLALDFRPRLAGRAAAFTGDLLIGGKPFGDGMD